MKILVIFLAICASSYAVKFNCVYSMVAHVLVGSRYTCTATVMDLGEGPNLTGVTGNHQLGLNNSNVEAVIINNQPAVTFIPQKMRLFYYKMTVISLTTCGMTTFAGNDLDEYVDLEYFSVYNNKIASVPGNLFHHAPRMRLMNFNYNLITHVGENLIEPLFFLAQALFSVNTCINHSVTNSSMACLVGTLRQRCLETKLIL